MVSEATIPPSPSLGRDSFIKFPKLPTELQLMIWKHAVPDPRIVQIRSIYPASTRSPELSQEQRCDAEATTPGHEVEFGTDAKASGLLGACQQSRQVVLKVLDGCIESGHRKIRFDKAHDVIFLHTTHNYCDRGLPGIYSQPDTLPDYRRIFKDVQHLAVCDWAMIKFGKEGLHSTGRTRNVDASRPWLVSEFRSLQTLYLVESCPEWMKDFEATAGEPILNTLEEESAWYMESFSHWDLVQTRTRRVVAQVQSVLSFYKHAMRLDDWKLPKVILAGINKVVALGDDKWTRAVEWSWERLLEYH